MSDMRRMGGSVRGSSFDSQWQVGSDTNGGSPPHVASASPLPYHTQSSVCVGMDVLGMGQMAVGCAHPTVTPQRWHGDITVAHG